MLPASSSSSLRRVLDVVVVVLGGGGGGPQPRTLGLYVACAAGGVLWVYLTYTVYQTKTAKRHKKERAPLCEPNLALTRALALGATSGFAASLENKTIRPMADQLGGLAHAESKREMMTSDGLVLKPVQAGERGEREVAFYEHSRLDGTPFDAFLCVYRGVVECGPSSQRETQSAGFGPNKPARYLVLDDCRRGMRRAATLDVKLGARTYEVDAPRAKRRREASKYPPQRVFGCRVVGMRVAPAHDNIGDDAKCDGRKISLLSKEENDVNNAHTTSSSSSSLVAFDKRWGYSLRSREALAAGLARFFGAAAPPQLAYFAARLDALLATFTTPNDLVFIGSSLLFVYDLDDPAKVDLRLIDFAHVRRETRTDHGCILGIRTLRDIVSREEGVGRRPNAAPVSLQSDPGTRTRAD